MNILQLPLKMRKLAEDAKKLLYDHREEIMAVYDGAKKGHKLFGISIKILEEVATVVRCGNLAKAEEIYKRKLISMSNNPSIKRIFSVGELTKFLNNKNEFLKTLEKLKEAKAVMDKVMNPLEKSIEIYKKASQAVGIATDAYKLFEQSKKLSSADDYSRYNLEVAKQFGSMCTKFYVINI